MRAEAENTLNRDVVRRLFHALNVFGNVFQCLAVMRDCLLPAGRHTVSCFRTDEPKPAQLTARHPPAATFISQVRRSAFWFL